MKYAIKLYTALCLIFILLLSISGSLSGIIGEIVYVGAFAVPLFIGLRLSLNLHRKREEEAGISLENKWYYTISGESLGLLAPLVMPAIFVIMIVSFLTSLLLSYLGFSNSEPQLSSLPVMLIMHALVPALLEELLFRFLPMKLILPYSKCACIIISSLYFALIHCNLFSIPYAILAGVIFISLDVAFDSVWPSFILHFLNNTLSVIMLKYCGSDTSYGVYFGICALILTLSVPFIIKFRRKYGEILKMLLCAERSIDTGYYPLLLIIPTALVAIINLF